MDTVQTSKAEFLASLEVLAVGPVPHQQIVRAFQSITAEQEFTMPEVKNVVDFAVAQLGLWRVRWLFSSAHTPDTVAQGEDAGWERVWEVFLSMLAKNVPDVEGRLRQIKDLSVSKALIQAKLERDAGSPASKLWAAGGGRLAIVLNRVGFSGIAAGLYKRVLYPPGTVGRTL